jgi:hypothetical protein
MAYKGLGVALCALIVAASASASQSTEEMAAGAPPGGEFTQYCMKVTVTGMLAEPVYCMTRAEWAEQGVDVDKEWAKEGVSVRG